MADQLVASSSLPPSWRYHVFLSFRGEDTRTNFTDHLYHALVYNEIKTFIDRHLPKGEEISPTLLKAIEESRISLVILSKNYADSRWCLEELVKIHQCRESQEQIILPVFYEVDPSHVRHQTGSYGDSFIGHERKFQDKEMVLRWRRALREVANLSGYHVKEEDYEATIISNIVKDILDRVNDGTYLKGSHMPKKSVYQLQITLDGYDFYEGEPFRDSQRVLRKSYDVWDDEIKQQPEILALRSNNNNNLDELVQLSEEDVKSKHAKFQIEPAHSGYGGLVHIKCCFNNKYLRRANDHQYWIVAGADEPKEDKKHWSCTLFKPVVVHSDNKAVFRLLHVQLGHFVTSFTADDFNQCLFAERSTPNLHNDMDVYTVVDLEPLVLPRSFALISNNNKKYLRYIDQRIENLDELVQLSEEDVKSKHAKFQMEPADSGYGGLVHIKCCVNNKYLRRANDHQYWIVAGANEPEEDKKHWSCTLFKPVVVHSDNKAVFRLLHVQLGHFVRYDFNQCLFAGPNTPNLHDNIDVYTVIDLEPLVLPSSLALKSNKNKKYLRYIRQRIKKLDEIVQLSEEDVKSEYAKFQIEPADGGLVHIKCCYNNKYLRRANDHQHWIVAGADEPEEDTKHWSCTLFEPVVVHSDNKAVFRLLHVQLGHFVTSLTFNDFNPCLCARSNTPNLHDDMDVYTVIDLEPLVLPSPFVLKSNNNNRYLRYMLDQENNILQILQFSAQDRTSEFAQFHVERANSRDHQNIHYVHIKCLNNNKYLRRMDKDNPLILAAADNRDENKERWTCTLFKPESVGPTGNNDNNVLCRLRHVATGLYTKPFVDNRFELRLGEENHDPQEVDVYTAIRTHT